MIIQHNIMALNSYNKLSGNNSAVQKNLEKLSSGYRINRAGDDAAGLAISEKMRAQITGLDRAKLNAQDGISLVQTAEGALTEVHSILNRLVELGTESANGIYQADDRQKIQDEVSQSLEEIDRISKATNFNGINLLDGSLSSTGNAAKTGGSTVVIEGKGLDVDLDQDVQISAGTKNNFTATVGTTGAAGGDKVQYTIEYVDEAGVSQTKDIVVDFDTDDAVTLKKALENFGFEDGPTASAGTALNVQSKTEGSKGAQLKSITAKSYGATGTETAVTGANADKKAATQVTVGEDEYRSNVAKFEKDFEAGNTVTIGNKTYEFVEQANLADVGKGNVGVIIGDNNAQTLDNLTQMLNANGVTAKVSNATDREIVIDDLSQISLNKGSVSFSSSTANVTAGEADATKGAWKMTAGAGTTADSKLTIRYTDDDGNEKTKVLDYNGATGATANAKAIADAIMADDDLKKLFTATLVDGATAGTKDSIRIEANTKGSGGAQIKTITTNDQASAITEAVNNVAKGTDAGKGITVNSGVKAGDTVTIGGKTFEFVTADGSDKVKSGNTAVILGDNTSKTTENLNNALVNAGFQTDYTKGMNALKVISGSSSSSGEGGLTLQVGDTADDYNKVTVSVDDMSSSGLNIANLQVTDQGLAAESITKVKAAIEKVSTNRGRLGALQNRLEHTINNLSTTSENMTAAESRIRDTDMAKEMMAFTKNNVLVQAAQSMLAQANQQPQQVLQLLR